MQDQTTTPGLIRSKPSTLVALFVTGLVAAMTIRGVLFHPYHHRSRWLFPIFVPVTKLGFLLDSVGLLRVGRLALFCLLPDC